MSSTPKLTKSLQADLPASLVVFLVALPLCLGIALASGAPLISGIIAGIIGGIVVGSLSGSQLGVSGPAAGLAVIVLTSIQDLGSFELFLVAVVLAGIMQIALGFAGAGIIAYYFPSSVIKGMLSGIGVIIFLKQIPHAFGYDADPVGEVSFRQPDGETTFSELGHLLDSVNMGPILISVVSLVILISWETKALKRLKFPAVLPGPLVAVVVGTVMSVMFGKEGDLSLAPDQIVSIPESGGISSFLTFPDFGGLTNASVYTTAIVIAIVASLETLLCVEAADKLDPEKRVTPASRELKAQGVGNLISGLIGGLPVTQVIVRSSANVQSGAKTKLSAIIHGFLLAISVIALPSIMNLIPLATLAAILCVVGYKLAKPSIFTGLYKQGWGQFIPFFVTVLGIVFTDLLTGIAIGMLVAVLVILLESYQLPFHLNDRSENGGKGLHLKLAQQVTFLNKARILKTLDSIPDGSSVEIDASGSAFVHPDVVEIIEDFEIGAAAKNIETDIKGLEAHKRTSGSGLQVAAKTSASSH